MKQLPPAKKAQNEHRNSIDALPLFVNLIPEKIPNFPGFFWHFPQKRRTISLLPKLHFDHEKTDAGRRLFLWSG